MKAKTVTAELSKGDVIKASLLLASRLKSTYINLFILSFLGFLVMRSSLSCLSTQTDLVMALGIAVSILAFSYLFYFTMLWFGRSSSLGLVGKHVYSIDDHEFQETTAFNDATIKWAMIANVKVIGDYLFIGINKTHHYYIVPKHAFADNESFIEFSNLVQQCSQATQSPSSPA